MQDHRNIRAWQRAYGLTIFIIEHSEKFSRDAQWVKSQLRRAAASISANIAEGAGQESSEQFGRFLIIALVSTNEALNHAEVAYAIGQMHSEHFAHTTAELEAIRAMTTVLLRRVRER